MTTSPLLIAPPESGEYVKRVLESITDAFCTLDAEWRITFLNTAAKQLLGSHLAEVDTILGQNHWEVFPDARGTIIEESYHRAVTQNVPVEFELFYSAWKRWLSTRAYPIQGGGLAIYFRDVTVEKESLETLRKSEERYRLLFNSIDEGFCVVELVWDLNGNPVDYRFIEVNPAFEKHSGLTNAIGKTALELIPDLEPHWLEVYANVVTTGQPTRFTQGSPVMQRWFDIYAFPFGATTESRLAVLFTDISARRDAENEVLRLAAEGRARLSEMETLLEVLPVGIGIALDRDCSNIRVNPAFSRSLGIAPDINASMTPGGNAHQLPFRVIDDEGREIDGRDLPLQVAAREGREIHGVELNVHQASGKLVRLLEYASPLFDEKGVPRGSVGAFVDITERQESENRQRFLIQLDDAVRPLYAPEEIVATAAHLLGEYLCADRCAYADVELDEDTFNLTGDYCRGVASIVGRYTFTQFGAEVLRLMRANEPYVVEDITLYPGAPADLSAYHATDIRAVICVPLHKGGKFVAAMAVHMKTPRQWTQKEVALTLHVANRCWEALERARVTRVLKESEERFRTLAENIAQLAWMADPDGFIFWYNKRWFDYTGTTLGEMQGWGWEKVLHPEHLDRMLPKWRTSLERGEAWDDTFPLRGADGKYRWFLSRAFPIRDGKGNVLRWFGTNTDVTEQREAADALARAKEEAEAASRAKDDFLAALSHELRTPLTPVLLTAAALQEDDRLPSDVISELAMIRQNIELESRLIDDLLDLTRIAHEKLLLRSEDCDAHELMRLALDIVRDEAQSKRLDLEVELQAEHSHLNGDRARIQQIFWNLLKNAVKFTPSGGKITIRSRNLGDNLILEVTDSGVGIPSEALGRIFLPFEQSGFGSHHRFGGLGLGLSISQAMAEMHHGKIAASSPGENCGATFSITLPISKNISNSTEQTTPRSDPGGLPPCEKFLQLLLVEDHEPTRAILTRLLTKVGHTVASADNLASARELAAGHHFDAVISDIGLPDGSGIDLMEFLKSTYGLRGIALSGYGMEEDVRRSSEAGFTVHLVKPIDFSQLRKALRDLAAEKAGPSPDTNP